MTSPLSDAQLGTVLTDLGSQVGLREHSLAPRVRAELESVAVDRRRILRFALALAAILLVALIATLSIAPARDAVARFFGIGSTSVELVDELPPAQPRDALTSPGDTAQLLEQLRDAGLSLPDATLVGIPVAWEVDPRAETTVAFAEVLLSQRRGGAPVSKQAPRPSGAELVSVGGSLGIWVPGEHVRKVGDRSFRSDSALVWVRRGIEYRLEGDLPLERMLGIARSLRAA